jgi:hypothetical protein
MALASVDLPQPTGLRERQSQPWHFAVFTPNTSDKRFKQRHTASVAEILSMSDERASQLAFRLTGSPTRGLARRRALQNSS